MNINYASKPAPNIKSVIQKNNHASTENKVNKLTRNTHSETVKQEIKQWPEYLFNSIVYVLQAFTWRVTFLEFIHRLHAGGPTRCSQRESRSDSKVHGANMGPTCALSAPDEPHIGPVNFDIRGATFCIATPAELLHDTFHTKHEATITNMDDCILRPTRTDKTELHKPRIFYPSGHWH